MSEQAQTVADERIKTETFMTRMMKKPELGAIAGVILVNLYSSLH